MAEESTFDHIVVILREQDGLEGVELTPETRLAGVGLDSLATVEVVMACEDEFDIEIDAESNPQPLGLM
ncbi:MAG: phosphopantetheine-binding protein [Olegusella sp.]|jgi:acyl carrier protein|nr:phosphopantetheine-binding protein [Olegusella sp.]